MSDDAGLKLLAAIESLSAEIRGIRGEMADDREARGLLNARREKDRDRKRRLRPPRKSEDSAEFRRPPQVVKALELDQDQEQDKGLLEPRKSADRPTTATWTAYREAHRARYGVDPTRNKRTNGQLANLLARIPAEEAPEIAAFYVRHNEAFYVKKGHPVGLLLQDCESLRTQWLTNKPITATASRQADETEANRAGWLKHLSEEGKNALGSK